MVLLYEDESNYDAPFPLLSLAFFLRYPNPFSRHIVAVDTLSRRLDPQTGTLTSERLILKKGKLPKWAPRDLLGGRGGVGPSSYVLETITVKAAVGGGVGPLTDVNGREHLVHGTDSQQRGARGWSWSWRSQSTERSQETVAASEVSSEPSGPSALDRASFFMQSVTRNIDHRRIMDAIERQTFAPQSLTSSTTTAEDSTQCQLLACFSSQFGWGLSDRVERFGYNRFAKQINESRAGLQHVIQRLKELRKARTSVHSALELDLDWGRKLSTVGLMNDRAHRPWRFSAA